LGEISFTGATSAQVGTYQLDLLAKDSVLQVTRIPFTIELAGKLLFIINPTCSMRKQL